MSKHISVVMTYVNRKAQLDFTLRTISKSQYPDFDVIIVDDLSVPEHQIDDLVAKYQFPIRVIRIPLEDKWFTNPCIGYNIGFQEAKGDIVLIQNPECCHRGDIISDAARVDQSIYLSFEAYGVTQEINDKLHQLPDDNLFCGIDACVSPMRDGEPDWNNSLEAALGWYNHHIHRPMGFHFAAAITRENLHRLNGFDERYAIGINYEDSELLVRIRRMGLTIGFETDPSLYVLHQWHEKPHISLWHERNEYNRNIFETATLRENTYTSPNNRYFNVSAL